MFRVRGSHLIHVRLVRPDVVKRTIMDINIYSNYIYLDTNILSQFAKDTSIISKLSSYLLDNNISLAFSGAHMAELSDAIRIHEELSWLLILLPSSLLHSWEKILEFEINAHPNFHRDSILAYPLNNLINEVEGEEKIISFLKSDSLVSARAQQKAHSRKMLNRHKELKNNFPPKRNGKYSATQANEFETAMVIQWLSNLYPKFLVNYKTDVSGLNIKVFKSIRLYSLVLFYKYYLGKREPNELSDFGDLFHLSYIPYCKLAVIERDLCNVLNQIKKRNDILKGIPINNIDFINSL